MEKFSKIVKMNEMHEADTVTFTKIQADAERLLIEHTKEIVRELKSKWFESDVDDFTWLEEKYLKSTLANLSEILTRKVKN